MLRASSSSNHGRRQQVATAQSGGPLDATKRQGEEQNEDSREIKLIVTSKHIALYVFIESDNIDFIASDNYFSMEPNESRIIMLSDINSVNSENEVRIVEIKDKIFVKSLFDLLN